MEWDAEPEDLDETEEEDLSPSPCGPGYPVFHRLLTVAEEISLCSRAQDENLPEEDRLAARNRMMEANLRLVFKIARRHNGRSMVFEDLVQEGIIGLFEAIKKFDITKGYKFSTYATYWIRQAIVRAIEKHDRVIRIPTYGFNAEKRIYEAQERLYDRLGRTPTVQEIAVEARLSQTIVSGVIFLGPGPLSLDAMCGEEGDTPLVEMLPDDNAANPQAEVIRQVVGEELEEALESLSERERQVIELRYGLQEGRTHTLQELALVFDMSREGIRHIEVRALKKLRKLVENHPTFQAYAASSSLIY